MEGLEQAIFQHIIDTGTFILTHNNIEVKEVIIKLKAQGFINNPYADKSKFIAVGEGLQVVLHKGWNNYQNFLNADLQNTMAIKAENTTPSKNDNTHNWTKSAKGQVLIGVVITILGGLFLTAIIHIIGNLVRR